MADRDMWRWRSTEIWRSDKDGTPLEKELFAVGGLKYALAHEQKATFSSLQEVKVSSAPFLLLRIPSLKLRVHGRKEAFEANLKTETDLWHLMVKEMWAGRNMADQHKVIIP